ncbi:Nucleoporin protein [Quillaja saponaria]|uniref:Nucleoporin protein n=1 Tax=Quillaja saponaria TaxID=32244 RepID=A0AAD7PUE4_QUISA|nr:Nucleoporin protein [Quillaja saponaria]
MLFTVAGYQEQHLFGNSCFTLDDKQIMDLRCSVSNILLEQSVRHEDLVVATLNLLTSAARFQDQAIAIVTELCEARNTKIPLDIQNVCLGVLEKWLCAWNSCLLQICGIRPVLGRVEDFSNEVKRLFNAEVRKRRTNYAPYSEENGGFCKWKMKVIGLSRIHFSIIHMFIATGNCPTSKKIYMVKKSTPKTLLT